MFPVLIFLNLLRRFSFSQFVTLGQYEYFFEFDNHVDYATAISECQKRSAILLIIGGEDEDRLIHKHIRSSAPEICE